MIRSVKKEIPAGIMRRAVSGVNNELGIKGKYFVKASANTGGIMQSERVNLFLQRARIFRRQYDKKRPSFSNFSLSNDR